MGRLGGAAALGMILGPGFGGLLSSDSLTLPFFVAAGISIVCLLLVLLFLPESLPAAARLNAGTRSGLLRPVDLWRALLGPLGLLFFLAFLVTFGMTNFQTIFGLYAMEKYGYGAQRVGVILTVVALLSAVGQGLLTGPLTARWGEERVIKGALLGSAAGFILMLLARSYPAVLLSVGFFELCKTLIRPAITSLTSQRGEGSQGALMGLINAFLSLGSIAGPLWAGASFDLNHDFPYLSGAATALIGFTICMVWLKRPVEETHNTPIEQPVTR
jgi:DHA1 family multidrug resistance protein-like MFS transporter